jgi:hypothetical protein
VSSRQDEKQRRRQERLDAERRDAAASARRQRLQWVFGGVLAIAAIAAIGIALAGGSSSSGKDGAPKAATAAASAKLPEQKTTDVNAAAKAAGCVLQHPPIEGQGTHLTKDFKPGDYKTNPPTSGAHNPEWYQDGIYEPGTTPRLGMLVHPLEHGRIEVQYKPGTPKATVARLEALLAEQSDGYHMMLFENTTGMKYEVAATTWGHLLGCGKMNEQVFDAIRSFRERYIDKGPERVP